MPVFKRVVTLCIALVITFLATSSARAAYPWVFAGFVAGHPTYFDTNTNLTWIATVGMVPSSDNGQQAANNLANLGFRLPSFYELKVMYNYDHGGTLLDVKHGLFDFYETSELDGSLANASGNGFQTRQPRWAILNNYYLGVK